MMVIDKEMISRGTRTMVSIMPGLLSCMIVDERMLSVGCEKGEFK